MVRRGDDHGVELVVDLVEQFAKIAKHANALRQIAGRFDPAIIDVADGDEVLARVLAILPMNPRPRSPTPISAMFSLSFA